MAREITCIETCLFQYMQYISYLSILGAVLFVCAACLNFKFSVCRWLTVFSSVSIFCDCIKINPSLSRIISHNPSTLIDPRGGGFDESVIFTEYSSKCEHRPFIVKRPPPYCAKETLA